MAQPPVTSMSGKRGVDSMETLLQARDFLDSTTDVRVQRKELSQEVCAHTHDFIEIAYVAAGTGSHQIGEEIFQVAKGDLFILSKYVRHRWIPKRTPSDNGEAAGEALLLVYNCLFQPEFIDAELGEKGDFVNAVFRYLLQNEEAGEIPSRYVKLSGSQSRTIGILFEDMFEEFQRKEEGFRHLIRADLTKLLIGVFRIRSRECREYHESESYKKAMVASTMDYMKNHCHEEIRLEELAARFYLSPSYFSRIFKEITGENAIACLQGYRMDTACEMLSATGWPVSEIARQVGYSDQKYFYELFRRKTGMSPGQYRTQYRNRQLPEL